MKRRRKRRRIKNKGDRRSEITEESVEVRERGSKRKKINEDIKMEEWKDYFMGLLGGVEDRVVRDTGSQTGGVEEMKET